MFELFIARRYLAAKRKNAVIGVVTVIAIAGVAAGVAALVIALSINNGFRGTLQRTLLGATAHVTVLEKEPGEGIKEWRPLVSKLARQPGVTRADGVLYGGVFLTGPQQSASAVLKGVDPAPGGLLDALAPQLRGGSLALLRDPQAPAALILGSKLAAQTGMLVGSTVSVIIPNGELTPFGPRPVTMRFRVAGIFESGFYDLDNSWAVTTIAAAQRAFAAGDVVNAVELKLADIQTAREIARSSEALAGPALAATDWMDQNKQLLNALRLERTVTIVTIGLIQLVAALNILITLTMMVMDKQRDIALLVSMGARRNQIRRIFMLEGIIIGALGTALGLVLGFAVSYFANRGQWIRLDAEVYALSWVPFDTRWTDALWVAAVALLVSWAATLLPARSAASVVPAESLRYE
ncbi:MAG: ABC transporter permease [Bryobacter sp.]|nr:ABC transporter permease [Bryobacter sp.]